MKIENDRIPRLNLVGKTRHSSYCFLNCYVKQKSVFARFHTVHGGMLTGESSSNKVDPAMGNSFQPATLATQPGWTALTRRPMSSNISRGLHEASPATRGPPSGVFRRTPRVTKQVATFLKGNEKKITMATALNNTWVRHKAPKWHRWRIKRCEQREMKYQPTSGTKRSY